MAQKTPNYNLNKPGYEDFGDVNMLNENFEKIDKVLAATDPTKVTAKAKPADGDGVMIADSADGGKAKRLLWSNVKAALGKLFVPLARKINGKALSADVTLTGDDIAMGADDAESLRAAMAKRPLMQYPKALDVHKITSGQLYWCDADTSNTPYKAGLTEYQQGLALCTARSAEEKWCSIIYISHAEKSIWIQSTDQGGWANWVQLAKCETPEIHELPLANGWQAYGEGLCWYTRNQFKEVTIGMLLRSTSALTSDGTQFATLPEGFRPKVTVIAPANVTANDYSHSACHVTINPDGGVYLHFDASSLSGKTVIQLVCPVFHYPVG